MIVLKVELISEICCGGNEVASIKKTLFKIKIMKIKFFIISVLGCNKQKYLKKHNIFGLMGNDVLFQPCKLPNEPKLIKIHNNVRIASGVTFYTHDVIHQVFEKIDNIPYQGHGYCIEIFDNVFIGGNVIIAGNVSIGPNAVIAAGSVILKDVKSGTVVAGNPAQVIASFDEMHSKRLKIDENKPFRSLNAHADELWTEYYKRKLGDN